MKKLLMILMILGTLSGFSQNVLMRTGLDAVKVISDSSFVIQLNDTTQNMRKKDLETTWLTSIVWASHDGTTSVLSMDYSIDGVTYYDYPDMATSTMTGATGSAAFGDPNSCEANFVRVYFDLQTGKVATFTLVYNVKRQ